MWNFSLLHSLSGSTQRWLVHARHFERNTPLMVFGLWDLLTECAAPSAAACCRRVAAEFVFVYEGRGPTAAPLAMALSHVFIFSRRQHGSPPRSACDFELEAAQGIKFPGFKTSFSAIHTKVKWQISFSNEVQMLHSCVLDFLKLLLKKMTLSSTDKNKLYLVFLFSFNLNGLQTFDFYVFSSNSRMFLGKNPAGLQRSGPRPPGTQSGGRGS